MIKSNFEKIFNDSKDGLIYDYELVEFIENIVLNNKNEIPSLFRYSPADYNNIRSLETERLFLSSLGGMNDIFEGISCEVDDRVLETIDDFNDIAFLKSFSEEKNNLLMWAHYAENYSGMCVEYDFRNLSNEILYHLYPVYYTNTRSVSRNLNHAIEEHKDLKRMNAEYCYPNDTGFIKDILSLFLTKSMAWSYEREWRIIATYPQIHNTAEDVDDEQKVLYGINSQSINISKCVKAVYLGAKMKEHVKKHIKEICRTKLDNIPVYSTRLSKNKYELEIVPERD